MVVHVLPCEHGGPGRAAHRRGHKGVGESGPTVLHDPPRFVHDLQGPQFHILVVSEDEDDVGSNVLPFLRYASSEPWGPDRGTEAPQQVCAQDGQNQSPARILHCVGSNVANPTKRLSRLVFAGLELGILVEKSISIPRGVQNVCRWGPLKIFCSYSVLEKLHVICQIHVLQMMVGGRWHKSRLQDLL